MSKSLALSKSVMTTLLSSESFFQQFPQFAGIRIQFNNLVPKVGCTTCAKKRAEGNLLPLFTATVKGLSADKLKEFKYYLKADNISISGVGPDGRFSTVVI